MTAAEGKEKPTSLMGQKTGKALGEQMFSAVHPTADMIAARRHFAFGPKPAEAGVQRILC
jgi:hypothetical protein